MIWRLKNRKSEWRQQVYILKRNLFVALYRHRLPAPHTNKSSLQLPTTAVLRSMLLQLLQEMYTSMRYISSTTGQGIAQTWPLHSVIVAKQFFHVFVGFCLLVACVGALLVVRGLFCCGARASFSLRFLMLRQENRKLHFSSMVAKKMTPCNWLRCKALEYDCLTFFSLTNANISRQTLSRAL